MRSAQAAPISGHADALAIGRCRSAITTAVRRFLHPILELASALPAAQRGPSIFGQFRRDVRWRAQQPAPRQRR